MFDVEKLKITPIKWKGFNSTASEQEIDELTQFFGHPLPENYVTILQKYNGGSPEINSYISDNEEYTLNYFFSLGRADSSLSIWWEIKAFSKFIGPNSLPFGVSGINELYYFKRINQKVEVWILRYDELEEPEEDIVADSFEEFLSMLYAGK